MKVCVLGAGFTGTLAGLVLSRSGCKVTLIDRRTDPRDLVQGIRKHAHVFRKQDIDLVARYLQRYDLSLPRGHCGPAIYGHDLHQNQIGIGRPSLDRILATAAERQDGLTVRYQCLVRSISQTNGTGKVSVVDDSGEQDHDIVLDATGTARYGLRLGDAAPQKPDAISVKETYVYTSWEGERIALPHQAISATLRLGPHSRVQILPLDQHHSVVTAVTPPEKVTEFSEALRLIRTVDPELAEILGMWSPSQPYYYKTSRLERVEAEWKPGSPIPIGEARIQTPPRFGDGFRHSCAQVGLLQQCLARGDRTGQIMNSALRNYAKYVWDGTLSAMQRSPAQTGPGTD